jgi:hypothetical protein
LSSSIITAAKTNTSLAKEPRIPMAKCVSLSIRQPYAELVVPGRKTTEFRKWNTILEENS